MLGLELELELAKQWDLGDDEDSDNEDYGDGGDDDDEGDAVFDF